MSNRRFAKIDKTLNSPSAKLKRFKGKDFEEECISLYARKYFRGIGIQTHDTRQLWIRQCLGSGISICYVAWMCE